MGVQRLVILLSIVAFVYCDFSPSSAPSPPLKKPAVESTPEKASSGKTDFSFHNFYHEFGKPTQFDSTNFSKFSFRPYSFYQTPLKPILPTSHITSFQGISPPFSNVIPPYFGSGNTPSLPINPSQIFPPPLSPPPFVKPPFNPSLPSIPSFPSISNFGLYSNYFGNLPLSFSSFPHTSFPSISLLSKDSPQPHEPLSTSYGPPAAAPPSEEPSTESPAQTSENNSSFDQQPISFPYEPAAPDAPEQQAFTPAQEYGLPNKQ